MYFCPRSGKVIGHQYMNGCAQLLICQLMTGPLDVHTDNKWLRPSLTLLVAEDACLCDTNSLNNHYARLPQGFNKLANWLSPIRSQCTHSYLVWTLCDGSTECGEMLGMWMRYSTLHCSVNCISNLQKHSSFRNWKMHASEKWFI